MATPNCPPTIALYLGAARVHAMRRYAPTWLWTLRRIDRLYSRQTLVWLALYALAYEQLKLTPAPRFVVPSEGT